MDIPSLFSIALGNIFLYIPYIDIKIKGRYLIGGQFQEYFVYFVYDL